MPLHPPTIKATVLVGTPKLFNLGYMVGSINPKLNVNIKADKEITQKFSFLNNLPIYSSIEPLLYFLSGPIMIKVGTRDTKATAENIMQAQVNPAST